jgi:LysR family transcriptional regulator, hydrogen peroxide-inducible genes activator
VETVVARCYARGMQIERNEIRVLVAVVEEGGFSRAAERLHISQSAVSQTVANLEHKLDTRLLLRSGRPRLTEAGKRLFAFAQSVIDDEQRALGDIQRIRTGALSTLNLGMNSVVSRVYGRALMLEFCERNPLTRLKLDVAPSRELIYGVEEDRWELGFGPFQQHMPGDFVTTRYFTEARLLVVHEAHPRFQELTAGGDAAETELAAATLLTSYLDDASRRAGQEQRLRNQFASVWEISNLELRLALAQAGKGVTYLSNRLLDQLAGFQVIEGREISRFERDVGLYYKRHRALSEGARRFIAICERYFAGG